MAFAVLGAGEAARVEDFAIPQLVGPGEVAERGLLPSCLYLPAGPELPDESIRLPWGNPRREVIGELARWQGTRVPGRLVASAKSWLCHPAVDRTAAILPWGAAADVSKLSPVEASARLLGHLGAGWEAAHPEAPLGRQDVVLTVPASFDEAARALTVAAARQAGLERLTLVEEPQAAFGHFAGRHRGRMAGILEGVRLVLVVDVGGGTTDFTLVQVAWPVGEGEPGLRRVAVGDHLMLGGDNMDAALGRHVEARLTAGGRALSAGQWGQLVQASRAAKEALLGEGAAGSQRVAVAGEGSRLVGGTLATEVRRDEVEGLLLDGFFPHCRPGEGLAPGPRMGLREVGLPYAREAGITRHLAAFLAAHAGDGWRALGEPAAGAGRADGTLPRPDAILLNGGVFRSARMAARLVEVVSSWWPEAPPIRLLEHDSLDAAVARGAVRHGLARRGWGPRIGGGTAHAFFVGLGTGGEGPPEALCVIPRGQEEGTVVDLGERVFQLTLGRPVRFPLFTSTSEGAEAAGTVVPVGEALRSLPPIHTLIESRQGRTGRVPVHLQAGLTEIGTLELWCVAEEGGERWRLEFEVRSGAAPEEGTAIESVPVRLAEAREEIDRVFGAGGKGRGRGDGGAAAVPAKALWGALERRLGPRAEWRLPALRELWGALHAGAGRRRRSADHERTYWQLLGYALRPGFGYPLDEWRCEQSARLFAEGVQAGGEKAVWIEWWVMWRRLAAGLSTERQLEIWAGLKPHLAYRLSARVRKQVARPKGPQPEGLHEMVRLAAALEQLPAEEKAECGGWVAAHLDEPAGAGGPWAWVLGRLGARMPVRGSVHRVVPPEIAVEWILRLIDGRERPVEGALFAAVQLARRTGDRARDVDDGIRARVLALLEANQAPPSWRRLVAEVAELERADAARALGDTLPLGLEA
ncbi:MAG: hsp70 family protein [Verrucomicrobiae bacterium]|nr:hsp70 family protein [Verrucomicrobiae bacterium]